MSLIDEAPEGANTPEFTVSELSRGVKRTLEDAYGHVRVRGELGRVTFHRNGHVYLDLKDENAVLAGVVWKSAVRGLEIRPREGDEVIASGRITTFAGQSKYQMVIESLAYAGEGALLAQLERLKQALAAEGLFADAAKRPLPYLPRVIGVVTSPTGAVIRDILHRLADRFPVHVLVWPVAVQGPQTAEQVSTAIAGFNAMAPGGAIPRPDVLIVARGGGSIEDLWGFNEEAVVRAAAASTIPLISAVGHETDTTLIDFAADRRAPTPTAAAEMAVPVRADLIATLADLEARRHRALTRGIERRRQRLTDLARALPRGAEIVETRRQRLAALRLPDPRALTREARRDLDHAAERLGRSLTARVQTARAALAERTARLRPRLLDAQRRRGAEALSALARRLAPAARRATRTAAERLAVPAARLDPALTRRMAALRDRLAAQARLLANLDEEKTLKRGFAIVRDDAGGVLTRAAQVAPGTALRLGFLDGELQAVAAPSPSASPSPSAPQSAPAGPSPGPSRATPTRRRAPRKPAAQASLFDDG
ncbi:MAG: exodeoxyribonuclease VII large subunit [Pseudomonadota bacterium]